MNLNRMQPHARARQRGIGLLEILVAMLIMAIGFLAVARMQIGALRSNQSAYHESQAQLLLDDMIDRMRNNMDGVRSGSYSGRDTSDASETDCATKACDAATLAARDLYQWAVSLTPVVPNAMPRLPRSDDGTKPAMGEISVPLDGVYTLTLTWEEMVDGAVAERQVQARFIP